MSKTTVQALEEALAEANLNYSQILSLAHKLAKEDENAVRFSVDASHISRLGLELVSKQETAISELIKNAFDADAVTVDVVFKNSDSIGGVLEVIDTGTGMSREQLLNGFMRISTADKVIEPHSPIYGRQRAGRKGIGRFAAQRLGKQLSIVTQMGGVDHSLRLQIDWDKFLSGTDLFMIESQIYPDQAASSPGTTIRIENLRDSWSEAQIRRAFRYVSDLLQPFPLRRKFESQGSKKEKSPDPGFKASFFKEENGQLITMASEEQNILGSAIAKISGRVVQGAAKISIDSTRYNINITEETLQNESRLKSRGADQINSYEKLNGISLTAHYFIQDELPAGAKGMVRDVLNKNGGIRVYRNGFRVLPYGESFDDWLSLQRSSALRELLPPHHNTNFIGFVEISDINGEFFEETASREGLIENEAFSQLQDFIYKTLVTGVIKIANARGKKVFASDKSKSEQPQKNEEEPLNLKDQADLVAQKIRDIAETKNKNESTADSNGDTAQNLLELADQVSKIGENSQTVLEEIGMLRVLASLGLTIGEFTHEVRHVLAALSLSVDALDKKHPEGALQLRNHIRLLSSYMRYFDQAVMQNAHRKLEAHELRDVIGEFVSVMAPTLKRQNVEVETKFEGYDLFTRPMHKSEWASTLLNLFTNSLKAIQRANVKEGKIYIFSSAMDDELLIEFSDNGDGIKKEIREKIFEPFFSTSSPSAALAGHADQITGTGLGLKIVKDIIEAADGEIEAIEPEEGFASRFRITIPRAKKHEISDDQY